MRIALGPRPAPIHAIPLPTFSVGCAAAWQWGFAAIAAAGTLLGAALVICAVKDISIGVLVRDPNAIAGQPFYYGLLESAGIVTMAGAGAAALTSAGIGLGLGLRGRRLSFLVAGGLLSLLLMTDDLFMLHENAWRLGLSEKNVFEIYGVLTAVFLILHARIVLHSSFLLLGASFVCLGTAVVLDDIGTLAARLPVGTEDVLELFGIALWCAYFAKSGRDMVLGALTRDTWRRER